MRAVVFTSPGHLEVMDVEDPTPGPTDVVLEVAGVGICGTDIHVYEGDYTGTTFPLIPGHETSGTVVAVGRDVEMVSVGDPVVVDPTLSCGHCAYCVSGRYNLCLSWNAMGVTGHDGASAQYVSAPAGNAHVLPPEVDLFQATMIEPLACAVRALDRLPRMLGEHYLVYGAGTMGLLIAQLAVRAGAASVSVVDPNDSRQAVARQVGVGAVAGAADELERSDWDVVVDCTGVVAAMEDGLPRVRPGGTFQHFGVAPVDARVSYLPIGVVRDEINIVGSAASLFTFRRAVDMFAAGFVDSQPMFSHAFSLDDYGGAMDMFRRGQGRKLQIRPNQIDSGEI